VAVEVGGGGSFVVLPLTRVGRLEHREAAACRVGGHSRPVTDLAFDPFNDNIIASASEVIQNMIYLVTILNLVSFLLLSNLTFIRITWQFSLNMQFSYTIYAADGK